jgi:two-component system response regulator PfeR
MDPTPLELSTLARTLWVGRNDDLQASVQVEFQTEGWTLTTCPVDANTTGNTLAGHLPDDAFDVILLDADALETPWEVLALLHQWQTAPVIVLARNCSLCVNAFRRGADDFLAKPINPLELLMRCSALLRRTNTRRTSPPSTRNQNNAALTLGPLVLYRHERLIYYNNRPIQLTAIQFKLLLCMARNHNLLLNKADLHRWVLNKSYCRDDRSIDMHLSRIRKKLETAGMPPDAIQTVRGHGYQLSLLPSAMPTN